MIETKTKTVVEKFLPHRKKKKTLRIQPMLEKIIINIIAIKDFSSIICSFVVKMNIEVLNKINFSFAYHSNVFEIT